MTHTLAKLDIPINALYDVFCDDTPIYKLPFNNLVGDTRQVAQNDALVILKSYDPNGNSLLAPQKISQYLSAVKGKVAFVLCESHLDNVVVPIGMRVVSVPDIRTFLGDLVVRTLPSPPPPVIAVTGTNGKTTISQLVAQLLSFDKKVGVIGTAGNGIVDKGELNLTPSTHTTPDVISLHKLLYEFGKQAQVVSLEASSHGLDQARLQGVLIKVAIFSNLTHDHLDYHTDMTDYASAKAKLFDKSVFPTLTHAIINLDDKYSQIFIDRATASNLTVWTYSVQNAQADIFASNITPSLDGVDMTVMTPQGQMVVKSPLLGRFNVANLLASIGAVLAMGVPQEQVQTTIQWLKGARGRMQSVSFKNGLVVVDYAHTPDALEQALKSLKPHCAGHLVAVFGCGGDRDKTKRSLMTQSALKYADKIILTSDNPRSEDPKQILKDMQQGLDCDSHYKIEIEADRKRAIELAIKNADKNDIVVIAGKGHETYQEIKGVRYDFDDLVIAKNIIDTL